MTRKDSALHVLAVVGLVLGLIGPLVAMPAQASPMQELEKSSYYALQDLDCGDAPDSYQTLLNSNGACHIAGPGSMSLGWIWDGEADGQPTPSADGDDANPPGAVDDEDGVSFPVALVPGAAGVVLVDGGPYGGLLDAWIDFNRNGTFDHPAEHLWNGASQGLPGGAGPIPLQFAVPAGAMPGLTYARFRLSSMGGLPPFGVFPEGEVEDYQVLIEPEPLTMDYGDAPDSYQTLLASDGARHVLGALLWMGAVADVEADGQPSPLADGDDLDALPDDEDGVTLPAVLMAGDPAASVTVDGGPAGGMLDAWIDFNGNLAFDAAEHLWAGLSQPVASGVQALLFAVPANAVMGLTYARFRLSANGGLAPHGLASEGEVEDYQILIEAEPVQLDYGDAPDTYQTLLASDGARHVIVAKFSLGSLEDAEADGQPSPSADGDDLNPPVGLDDEDGVTLPAVVTPGDPAVLIVVDGGASGGMLDAWIDFDGSGMFDHPVEHLWSGASQALAAGPNGLQFAAPANAMPGPTYARFRLSTNGKLPPFGLAPDGEVEDYPIVIEGETLKLDYGDAPDSYRTLLASVGARHVLGMPLWMGPTVDFEPDGQPSPSADRDDLDVIPDDEDGVTLPAYLIAGDPAAQVIVDGGPSGGMLDAWIDFNGNGAFDHPAEHLWAGVSQGLAPGPNVLLFAVPVNALPGTTYARFRLSGNGKLTPVGLAADGEVEDYRVPIEPEPLRLDYGDAPDSYHTLLASNGACHRMAATLPRFLGASVDIEVDGQPTSGADGDDLDALPDDEDGVTLPAVVIAGDPAVKITVDGGPTGGLLDAWIDFDGNGAFDHPAEHLWLGTSQALLSGPNGLQFVAPVLTAPLKTYARFRLSSNGNLTPVGLAADGEVEDYLVAIDLFTLDYAPGPHGSLTGNTHQTVPYGGGGTPVTAVANAGYGFAHWSDGSTANPRTDTNVTANVNVIATFLRLLGDVNLDGLVNSTDALIVLTADAGLDASAFCPMNYGDVNGDGLVNSTDALIILTYDAGLPVPFAVGQPAVEPVLSTQPPGCS